MQKHGRALKLALRNWVNNQTGQTKLIETYCSLVLQMSHASDAEKDPQKKAKISAAIKTITEEQWFIDKNRHALYSETFNPYKPFQNKILANKISMALDAMRTLGISR